MWRDEGSLEAVARHLSDGANSMDQVATNLPDDAIDAGFSSDVVNSAMARVGKAALVLAQLGEDIAAKVDAADGSYGDIENTNAGRMRYEETHLTPLERGWSTRGQVMTDDEVGQLRMQEAQARRGMPDNPEPALDSQPEAAPPGRTPEPPPQIGPTG
ncbi:MAG: hypothetical protein GEU97_22990 [Actinophytocola sp.]|nr:hypothetical protein [Actinophytocola sp.]